MIGDKETEKEKKPKDSINTFLSTLTQPANAENEDLSPTFSNLSQPSFTTPGANLPSGQPPIIPVSQPVFIGIAGGTASGKTTIAREIIERLNKNNILTDITDVALISLDSFYRDLTSEESEEAAKRNFDFDCENAFDFAFLHDSLRRIKKGEAVKIFEYDFVLNKRKEDSFVIVEKPDVVILEGILTLHNSLVRKLLNIKLFVECDSDIRLGRRIDRDIKSRGRKLENVLEQYFKFVKPGFETAVFPSKKYADLSVNTNKGKNPVAVELVCAWIKDIIVTRHGGRGTPPSSVSPSPSPSSSPSSSSLSLSPSPSSSSQFTTGPVIVSNQ